MINRFHPLCEVNLWHDFAISRGRREFAGLEPEAQRQTLASYVVGDWLELTPSPSTVDLMHRLHVRKVETATGFQLWGEAWSTADGVAPTVMVWPDDAAFLFAVEVRRASFFLEASLPGTLPPGRKYRTFLFRNANANETGGQRHLTQSLAAFDATKTYRAGDVCVHQPSVNSEVLLEARTDRAPAPQPVEGEWTQHPVPLYSDQRGYDVGARVLQSGRVFRCGSPVAQPAAFDPARWVEQYEPALRSGVTAADLVLAVSSRFHWPLSQPQAAVAVRMVDSSGFAIEQRLVRPDGAPLVDLDFSVADIPTGLYAITAKALDGTPIPDLPSSIYRHELSSPPFAYIEIRAQRGTNRAIFGPAGQPLNPSYHIRFRARHAWWRCRLSTPPAADFLPADHPDYIMDGPARCLTREPQPFSLAGTPLAKAAKERLLPSPDPGSLRREADRFIAESTLSV